MTLEMWCNKIIRYSFYLLFVLVPLILTPWNYELFEFNKMIVTYGLTVVIMTAWAIKMTSRGKLSIQRSPLDIPIVLFVLSQLISSLFSMDPHVSWFGYYSRFNGGMLSVFCYALLYFAFVSNWNTSETQTNHSQPTTHHLQPLHRLLYLTLGSASLVATYGILERMGIDKNLWVQDVQNRVFSTLGQPNWLAAYLVALMPVSLYYTLQPLFSGEKKRLNQRSFIFSVVYVALYCTLLFTRSRSGIVAFGLTLLLWCVGITVTKFWNKKLLVTFLSLHLLLLGITFFNGSNIDKIDKYFSYSALQQYASSQNKQTGEATQAATPAPQQSGTLLEYGGTESGTIRKYVWEAAFTAWKSSQKALFIGTGTETFAFAFFQYKPIAHNLTSEWDFLYNKAHNEYLNYLATTGILGLGAYILLLGVVVFWFLYTMLPAVPMIPARFQMKPLVPTINHDYDKNLLPLGLSLFAGWVSILITNFFGFSVVIIQIFLFLFPAFIFILKGSSEKESSFALPRKAALVVRGLAVVVGTLGILYVGVLWMGDYFFSSGYRLSRSGQLANSYKSLTQATFFRPREPLYYDELSVVLGSLSIASLEAGNATSASELAQQSLAASDIALSIAPNNVNFWKSRTKIYFGFADLDPKFVKAAKDSLEKAYTLSPFDPKITYNLAILDGRLGENEKAIDILKKTVNLKPNYRDAYFALYVFYDQVGQPELAKAVLQEYLKKVDPNDKEFLEKLKPE